MKTIAKIILTLIFSLLLSLTVFYHTDYDGLIAKIFGIGILEIESGSMESELSIGDIIIIKECEEYKINDIITYNVDNQYLVTHRIVERNGNSFVTKGDNNNAIDNEKITQESIEGKVICKSRLIKLLYTHWIIVILLIFCILIIC